MTLMQCGHEALEEIHYKFCLICGSKVGVELHHWQGRQYTKELGTLNDCLLTGVIPLCKKCHDKDIRGEHMLKLIEKRHGGFIYAAMYQAWLKRHRIR